MKLSDYLQHSLPMVIIEMALEPTFWGALYGAFTDQFGIRWMVNCQLNEG